MMRWSFQLLHGCVPVAPSEIPSSRVIACSCERRSRHQRGRLGEVAALAGADLGLRGDQLADEVRLDLGAGPRGLDLLEAVHEPERLGVEQRELLFDRDGEVGACLERRAGGGELLLCRKALFLAHGGAKATRPARAGAQRRPPTTSGRRQPGARLPGSLAVGGRERDQLGELGTEVGDVA